MNRQRVFVLALCAGLAVGGRRAAAQAAPGSSADTVALVTRAHQVFDSLQTGKFTQVLALFNADMIAAIPTATKLAEFWDGIIAQTGALKDLGRGEVRSAGSLTAVIFMATFDKGMLLAMVAYGPGDRIAGLAVRPAAG